MATKVILVIDDDGMNLRLAKMILERKLNCEVVCATGGKEGLEVLRSRRVNLVLLDVMMPEFDGIETLQAIRNDAHIRDVPVMMLTASGGMENIRRVVELGVKDYIKKPFLPDELVARIEKKLAEELPSTDILIIGDNFKVLRNLKEVIEHNFKYEILIAGDYADAVEILNETKLSLIIACAEMNFIDGLKILTFLANNERFKETPFAVTSLSRILVLIDKLNASPGVGEVAGAVITRSEKKKIADIVTNLTGYESD